MDRSLEASISRFLDHLKFEKRYSPHTLRSYHDDLIRFRDHLAVHFGGLDVEGITSPIIRSWLASLKEDGLSSRSIIRKISSLKSFFKFAIRSEIIKKTPMTNISSPRLSKKLPVYVEEKVMDTLFRHVEFSDDWNGYTGRLAMQMLYQLGLRLSELVSCKESQVDFGNGNIKILGKGNKERVLPVQGVLLTEIKEYINQKKLQLEAPDKDHLFVNEKGRKLYPKYIYRLTQKYLQKVTTIEKKSPHVLRHSFATHLSNNGAELNAVKELLGHASLAATQVYTHNTIEKLKNVHRKAHPKG
jgi:integrase/recombinase XerC